MKERHQASLLARQLKKADRRRKTMEVEYKKLTDIRASKDSILDYMEDLKSRGYNRGEVKVIMEKQDLRIDYIKDELYAEKEA